MKDGEKETAEKPEVSSAGKDTAALSVTDQGRPPKRLRPARVPGSSSIAQTPAQINFSLAHAQSKTALLVNRCQVGNPVLHHIRHVRKEFTSSIAADFQCGPTTCALFLSLQYHLLHPRYVYSRIRAIGRSFRLRILLVLTDIAEHRAPMHELSKLGLVHNFTVVASGCEREAARYLETLRSYDSKGAEGIQERVGADYASRVNAALSSVRGVNRTDVTTLAFTFGKFRNLAMASEAELRACPGVGERKVARLYAALHQPFRTDVPWTGGAESNDVAEDIEEVS